MIKTTQPSTNNREILNPDKEKLTPNFILNTDNFELKQGLKKV